MKRASAVRCGEDELRCRALGRERARLVVEPTGITSGTVLAALRAIARRAAGSGKTEIRQADFVQIVRASAVGTGNVVNVANGRALEEQMRSLALECVRVAADTPGLRVSLIFRDGEFVLEVVHTQQTGQRAEVAAASEVVSPALALHSVHSEVAAAPAVPETRPQPVPRPRHVSTGREVPKHRHKSENEVRDADQQYDISDGVQRRVQAADSLPHGIRREFEGLTLGRNDPCWCGSGKRFRICHGA
jgi:hypothetical protein